MSLNKKISYTIKPKHVCLSIILSSKVILDIVISTLALIICNFASKMFHNFKLYSIKQTRCRFSGLKTAPFQMERQKVPIIQYSRLPQISIAWDQRLHGFQFRDSLCVLCWCLFCQQTMFTFTILSLQLFLK